MICFLFPIVKIVLAGGHVVWTGTVLMVVDQSHGTGAVDIRGILRRWD